MALFIKLMRTVETMRLVEEHPREFSLLAFIALRMGADGSPARIGCRDFVDGDDKGAPMRYRRAKNNLAKWNLARFETSTLGTLAWIIPGQVFGMGGGGGVKKDRASDIASDRDETEQETEQETELNELKIDKKDRASDRANDREETEQVTEHATPNKELNTRYINTIPYISPLNHHQRKNFSKPTVAEIKSYCESRNNGIDASRFFDFYESKGWKVGNAPMRDWQAAVRTWESKTFSRNTPAKSKFSGRF